MKPKTKYIFYWVIFLTTLIYSFYEIAKCPFIYDYCSLNWVKFAVVVFVILASSYGIYSNKDLEEIKEEKNYEKIK